MAKLVNPYPLFLDGRGDLLDGGYVYIGEDGTDPEIEANQLDLYWDKALTIPAEQPLRTLGGMVVNASNPGMVYFAEIDFSTTIRDARNRLVFYSATAFDLGGVQYQPLDSDLTAIAALASTAYGRQLLTLANQAALQATIGIGDAGLLPVATSAQFRANTADKVLDTDCVWAAAIPVALADTGGAVAFDLGAGINFVLPMTASTTILNPANGKPGQTGFIQITQDAAGNRTLAYEANWKFAGGIDPILSTAANARDLLHYQVLADGTIFGALTKALS